MLNKKTIIKLISALPIALIAISPNIAYADNSGGEQSSSETSQIKNLSLINLLTGVALIRKMAKSCKLCTLIRLK